MFKEIKKYFKEKTDSESMDHVQKMAWQLVRSAEDRFPAGDGHDKRQWCVARLAVQFPCITDRLEDFVRAAHINLQIETGNFNRRLESQ